MQLTNDSLKDMAVEAVSRFVANQTPLNETIAELSERNQLNSEQIKRVVEASNQLAYLKLLDRAKDRTFEFPVADTDGVMESISGVEKTASMKIPSPMSIFFEEDMEKSAETKESAGLTKEAKITLAWKALNSTKAELEKLAVDSQEFLQKLSAAGAQFKKDPLHLNKLAQVAEEDVFNPLSVFLGADKEWTKQASHNVFRDSDLEEARSICYLYKEAKELVKHKKALIASMEKASGFLGETLNLGAKGVATVTGGVIGGAATLAAKGVKNVAKGVSIGTKKLPITPIDLLAGVGYKPEHSVWDSLHAN